MIETGTVEVGRAAFARGDWRAAFESFSAARSLKPLELDDLAALAKSAWWLGDVQENLSISEEVFHGLCESGRHVEGAMKALELCLLWAIRGDVEVASGWISRARRILKDEPEGPAHGYLLYLDASIALEFTGTLPTGVTGQELIEMSARFSEPALNSLGLIVMGLADLREARAAEGFAKLDEAMLPVMAGAVPPEWAGDVYCTIIHVCYELADYRRMEGWTETTERWCERYSSKVLFRAVCRVHRLELQGYRGNWADVERSIADESEGLEKRNAWVAGEGFYQLGEIRRLRGDAVGARAAYEKARRLGIEPQPGEALLALAEGSPDSSWNEISMALAGRDRLGGVRVLGAAVEIALCCGRNADAERLCSELEQAAIDYASAGFGAWAAQARGSVLLAQSRPAEALAAFRSAADFYRSNGQRHKLARVHAWTARAHDEVGEPAVATAQREAALRIFAELGAEPDLRTLPEQRSGVLTAREQQVLERIARGMSNREAGESLFISEKTVGRHLANIFVKIGVSSRTAAAAWARDQGRG